MVWGQLEEDVGGLHVVAAAPKRWHGMLTVFGRFLSIVGTKGLITRSLKKGPI